MSIMATNNVPVSENNDVIFGTALVNIMPGKFS